MNKALNLKILDKAEGDMLAISEYISRDNTIAAANLLKRFYKVFEILAQYPEIGTKRPDFTYKDVMFYVVKKNYLIIYKTERDNIYILRVLPVYKDICAIL